MASNQSKILNEILNQREDELKKLEEFVKEWKIKEIDMKRQYQEKHKMHFVFPFFFSANHTHSFFLFRFKDLIYYYDFNVIKARWVFFFFSFFFFALFSKNMFQKIYQIYYLLVLSTII